VELTNQNLMPPIDHNWCVRLLIAAEVKTESTASTTIEVEHQELGRQRQTTKDCLWYSKSHALPCRWLLLQYKDLAAVTLQG
jgi:hypothetical protein